MGNSQEWEGEKSCIPSVNLRQSSDCAVASIYPKGEFPGCFACQSVASSPDFNEGCHRETHSINCPHKGRKHRRFEGGEHQIKFTVCNYLSKNTFKQLFPGERKSFLGESLLMYNDIHLLHPKFQCARVFIMLQQASLILVVRWSVSGARECPAIVWIKTQTQARTTRGSPQEIMSQLSQHTWRWGENVFTRHPQAE